MLLPKCLSANGFSNVSGVAEMSMRKKLLGTSIVTLSALAAFLIITVVILVMGTIVVGGKDTLTWEFLSAAPREGMTEGGIFPAIVGTALLVIIMSIVGVPIGTVTAIYHTILRFSMEGIPEEPPGKDPSP